MFTPGYRKAAHSGRFRRQPRSAAIPARARSDCSAPPANSRQARLPVTAVGAVWS